MTMTRESTDRLQTIRVIGIGNKYRNDDGIGLMVARKLKELGLPSVTTSELPDALNGLPDALMESSSAIIVDAVASGALPGTIIRIDAHRHRFPSHLFRNSTHSFSVTDAVELVRVLGKLPRHCLVLGIEGGNFDAGTTISAAVESAGMEVVENIVQEVEMIAGSAVSRAASMNA